MKHRILLIERQDAVLFCGALEKSGCFGVFVGLAEVFHRESASIESDGARKASSANFFHCPEAFLNPDGVKKLVLAHFSIAGRLISASMDSEKASFLRVLHRQKAFFSTAG